MKFVGQGIQKVRTQAGHTDTHFCPCDLDLDSMTLRYEGDLNILNLYLHTKNEVSRSMLSSFKN